jgi:predicted nucleic acid-binding protein
MLVDTSVWIDYFNGHASPEADRLAQAIADAESIALPGLVWTEILLGLRTESEAVKISVLLEAFDYVEEPAKLDYIEAARIYRICRAKGYTIRSTIDCVIARLCLRDGLPLLCIDRDFRAIAECFPLHLVATI